jgi:hypothetical protein
MTDPSVLGKALGATLGKLVACFAPGNHQGGYTLFVAYDADGRTSTVLLDVDQIWCKTDFFRGRLNDRMTGKIYSAALPNMKSSQFDMADISLVFLG